MSDLATEMNSCSNTKAAYEKVRKLYYKGTNCDKAVLKVLQEKMRISQEIWDLDDFYSENPDENRFICKGLLAGALAIYLQILQNHTDLKALSHRGPKKEMKRINTLFNTLLAELSQPDAGNIAGIDPFSLKKIDLNLQDLPTARREYHRRATRLYNAFISKFGDRDCQGLLGFNPFNYLDYDEKMQEYIEGGEWMDKCCDYIGEVVKLMYTERNQAIPENA